MSTITSTLLPCLSILKSIRIIPKPKRQSRILSLKSNNTTNSNDSNGSIILNNSNTHTKTSKVQRSFMNSTQKKTTHNNNTLNNNTLPYHNKSTNHTPLGTSHNTHLPKHFHSRTQKTQRFAHTTSATQLSHSHRNTSSSIPLKSTRPKSYTSQLPRSNTSVTTNNTTTRFKNNTRTILHQNKRFVSEYERPFSLYKGTLDAFLVGSRRNYVRPSVTHAAGLGNTSMRHIRLYPEDYTHNIPAHRALPRYFVQMIERRPGFYMSLGIILLLTAIYDDYRRTNELYDKATDSIFALKSKNFLIKQGERIFLETVLIMFYDGIIEPAEEPDETTNEAAARFALEIQGMLAEIERHRDFRLSNIPLNFLEVAHQQKQNSFLHELQLLWHKPLADPFHYAYQTEFIDGVEFDTPWDIIKEQRALIDPIEDEKNFTTKLDSSGVGSLYGLFYPLITRYHHIPTELSIQAVPQTMQHSIRTKTAPMSKFVGRVKDRLRGSTLHDQFQESHRNEAYGNVKGDKTEYGLNIRQTIPDYWSSDIPAEIYNSYYLQRTANLIKRCHDIDGKVSHTMFGEQHTKELMMTYLSKAHRVLLERQFSAQGQDTFSPGDNHLFRYYYKRYSLVPYLNSLQYEMSELVLLRQKMLNKVGRAVGVEPELEQFSPEVLHLLDPFDTRPRSNLRELVVEKADGTRVVLNDENSNPVFSDKKNNNNSENSQFNTSVTALQGDIEAQLHASAPQLQHRDPVNPDDISLITPNSGSMTFASTSMLNDSYVQLNDKDSDFAKTSRFVPKLPVAITNTVDGLYQPVKIHNLIETITENQYNMKGLNILVDSLHHAQLTHTPQLYPCLGVHPLPLSQENYYVRTLFNPLQNAFGITNDEKYLRGLLSCIDVTLLRNAIEYQRWLHLVPLKRETLWEKIHDYVLNTIGINLPSFSTKEGATIENNYLDRKSLPKHLQYTYDGTYKPYSTIDTISDNLGEILSEEFDFIYDNQGGELTPYGTKPIYSATGLAEESWSQWFYRNMGWDYGEKTEQDYRDEFTARANDPLYMKQNINPDTGRVNKVRVLQDDIGLPFGNYEGHTVLPVPSTTAVRNAMTDQYSVDKFTQGLDLSPKGKMENMERQKQGR